MLEFLEKYSGNIWASQNGEEKICIEVNRRLGIEQGQCVEIGAANGIWASNTALLIRDYGWTGKMIEANPALYEECKAYYAGNPKVTVINATVHGGNVNTFVVDSCDLLSCDTDGRDYEIFLALIAKPKIVIIEIDSSMPLDRGGFNADGAASYRTMVELGIAKSFKLICHTGNLVFCDAKYSDLFPEIDVDPLAFPERYFNPAVLSGDRSWLNR